MLYIWFVTFDVMWTMCLFEFKSWLNVFIRHVTYDQSLPSDTQNRNCGTERRIAEIALVKVATWEHENIPVNKMRPMEAWMSNYFTTQLQERSKCLCISALSFLVSYRLAASNVGSLPPSFAHMAVMAKLNYSFHSAECGLCMIPIIILLDLSDADVGICFEHLSLNEWTALGVGFPKVVQNPLVFNFRTHEFTHKWHLYECCSCIHKLLNNIVHL